MIEFKLHVYTSKAGFQDMKTPAVSHSNLLLFVSTRTFHELQKEKGFKFQNKRFPINDQTKDFSRPPENSLVGGGGNSGENDFNRGC
ncbi:hypothetical protein CEXT_392771 [Caerostris extrusa]|uniref:Uncharacterized protein n=1 Tax=Caerostris extrusa TaxID=172846 RepID=A0AAV4MRY1_CAEEX|nr:hypothetical protein CEXT_392771 [Caerostris extrusa]